MAMMWEQFWWGHINGPRSFIKSLAECVSGGQSVQLIHQERSSLQERMRDAARNEIDPGISMKEVNAMEASREGIGDYLLRQFTSREGYRPTSMHWSDYLRRTGSLRSSLLWIYNIQCDITDAFAEDFIRLRGVCPYILEICEGPLLRTGAKVIDPADYITEYDYLTLASSIAAKREDVSDLWRRYLADLALELYSRDAERIVDFVEHFDITCTPAEYDTNITDKSVWKAQLRSAFHLIEEDRNAMLSRYEMAILECLPETQYYQEVTNPYDCELGLLYSLTSAKRVETGKRRLILAQDDYNELYFLLGARNQLAHNKCLTPAEMKRLLCRVR